MTGEKILAIYEPINDEKGWVIFQTDVGLYEVRLGLILRIDPSKVTFSDYHEIDNDKIEKRIIQAWTDDQIVYLELEDDSVISIGFLEVDHNGDMHLTVFFNERSDFGEDFIPFEDDVDIKKTPIKFGE